MNQIAGQFEKPADAAFRDRSAIQTALFSGQPSTYSADAQARTNARVTPQVKPAKRQLSRRNRAAKKKDERVGRAGKLPWRHGKHRADEWATEIHNGGTG
jgi:hypothetical protein